MITKKTTQEARQGFKALSAIQLALAALALSACGGGGGDTATAPVTPPAPASLTIGGTAATGAAMASAAVQVKCATGSGNATANADGVFSVSISGGALPCVLAATSSDGKTVLRSVAEAGTATSATANITPLSEIIAAKVAGGDAAALFSTFDAAAQAKLTATAVGDAKTVVVAALKGTVDLTGLDPLKDSLVAATPGKAGNALDQKLDTLGAALKAGGSTVAEVAAAVVANPTAPAVADALLKPAASSCAALRSGSFFGLDPYDDQAVEKFKIDAAKLELTAADGEVTKFSAVAEDACAFTADAGTTTAFVARSGVIVVRYLEGNNVSRLMLIVPEQTVPLAEMAGTWNIVTYMTDGPGTAPMPGYSVQTLNSSSLTTAGSDCEGLAACKPWTPRASDVFTVNPAGGYLLTDDEGTVRAFPVKTAGGQMAVFAMAFDTSKKPRGVGVFVKQAALALPNVDQVDKVWDLETGPAGAKAATSSTLKVKSVDAAAKTFTRERSSDGRIDTIALNKPRDGMRYRAAGTSGNLSFGETLMTPLAGLGITLYTSVGTGNYFGVSVLKP